MPTTRSVKIQDFTSNQLVGCWRGREGAYTCDWVLQRDGTFTADVSQRGVAISRSIGTWTIEGGELVSVCTKDEFDLIGPGHIERDMLLEVSADYFILGTRQGIRR